jgi:hypothetical protein
MVGKVARNTAGDRAADAALGLRRSGGRGEARRNSQDESGTNNSHVGLRNEQLSPRNVPEASSLRLNLRAL